MRAATLATALALLALGTGCATKDSVAGHVGPPPVCKVHDVPMHPEYVRVTGGERIYVLSYYWAQGGFPNHGGWFFEGEREDVPFSLFYRRMHTWVCPECTARWQTWWHEWRAGEHRAPAPDLQAFKREWRARDQAVSEELQDLARALRAAMHSADEDWQDFPQLDDSEELPAAGAPDSAPEPRDDPPMGN